MSTNHIIEKAEQFLKEHYGSQFSAIQLFHNLNHSLRVKEACLKLADLEGISETEKQILALAALFHDSAYFGGPDNHEERSAQIARNFLIENGADEDLILQVESCIRATVPSSEPDSIQKKVLKDADMAHLGAVDYFSQLNLLRAEWELMNGTSYNHGSWWTMNEKFLRNHSYYTEAAKKLFGKQKQENLETVVSISSSYQEKDGHAKAKKKGKKKKKEPSIDPILETRTAQMMFKTSLRNHIDLTNIADNKANIILSINALINTISIPLILNMGALGPKKAIPFFFLFTTSIVSIIFAALVTRPVKIQGFTNIKAIKEGKSNLFFFGNFYKMNLQQYEEGLRSVGQ